MSTGERASYREPCVVNGYVWRKRSEAEADSTWESGPLHGAASRPLEGSLIMSTVDADEGHERDAVITLRALS